MDTEGSSSAAPSRAVALERRLLLVQAVYFLVTGLWPVLHIRSFLAITGPKVDVWLVKTVGLLITAVGVTLLHAGIRGKVTPEVRSLGAGSALALMSSDIYYAGKGRISSVYLLDAMAEAPFVLALLSRLATARREDASEGPVNGRTRPA